MKFEGTDHSGRAPHKRDPEKDRRRRQCLVQMLVSPRAGSHGVVVARCRLQVHVLHV